MRPRNFLQSGTQKGLHRVNRLAFGTASAPAIRQRAMELVRYREYLKQLDLSMTSLWRGPMI